MHPRISVSAISTMRWTFERDLAFWAEAGIEQVGISLRKLEAAGIGPASRRVADSGLDITNVVGTSPIELAHPEVWPREQERLLAAVEAAALMDAGCLVLTTGPAEHLSWEEAADALEEALRPVLEAAAGRHLPFALEHTNSLRVDVSFLHSLRDAFDLAARLHVGVCMEVNACWAERGLAGTLATAGPGRLRLVQVSDFLIGTLTTPDRAVPGDGHIPIFRVLRHVLDAGYSGFFDLELIGPRIEAEGYPSAIRRALQRLGDLLSALGV